ncbi:MAG: hypothetical protein R3324_15590, partial [Halobacteriales archaeon]|nr:hypothetical protein [Halobacteriales archaeon]
MLLVAGIQILAGLLLLLAPLIFDPVIRSLCSPAPGPRGFLCHLGPMDATLIPPGRSIVLTTVVGLGFIAFGGLLFLLVANARLSDRFRAEEYRDRLRAIGVGTDDRPPFVPARGEIPSNMTESAKNRQRSDRADQGSDSGEITDRSRSDKPADPPD